MFDMVTLAAVNTENLLVALDILWKGMLGIFVVMALIYIAIKILNFVTNKQKIVAFLDKLKSHVKPDEEKAEDADAAEETTSDDEDDEPSEN